MNRNKITDTSIILLGLAIIMTNIAITTRYIEIDNRLDNIASETDATNDKIEEYNSSLEEYKQEQNTLFEELQKQLDDFKDDIQDEIDRIDEDIEAVEIAKAEARQKRQAQVTYTPTYTASTDGLTARGGVNNYEGHRESYYNLDMSRVVNTAQNNGIQGEYWVRDDGVKMLGDYVIVSANQGLYPYGSTVETSLGTGIVIDTGSFINTYPEGYDIATDW